MFDPILGYSAGTYEAIIAVLIVLGLIQTLVLRRKANQLTSVKKALVGVVSLSTATLLQAVAEVSKWRRRALAAQREAMLAAADRDDRADNRSTRRPARNDPGSIGELMSFLSSPLAGRDPHRDPFDVIFGRGPGRRFPNGSGRSRFVPDIADSPFSLANIKDALNGDVSGMERAVGADPGSLVVEVLDANMQPVSPAERAAVLSAINDGSAHVGSATDLGTALHREIEAANKDAARHFGPDSGGKTDIYAGIADAVHKGEELRKADVTAQPHETVQAEACGTQHAPSPPVRHIADEDDGRGFHTAQSPRAG